MSIEVTIFETKEKIEVMVSNIGSYKHFENNYYATNESYSCTWVELKTGGNINVIETVPEIKKKLDEVNYLKKISQYLNSMDSAIDDIKHEVKGLRRL